MSLTTFVATVADDLLAKTQALLDFSRDFDVSLMDRVVMAFYSGVGPEVRVYVVCTLAVAHLRYL